MKAKYATLIRSLLRTYSEQASAIEKETFSIHSDGIQLMELNLQLAKCLEGISATARFNNDVEDFNNLHTLMLMAFNGDIPAEDNIPGLVSLASCSVKDNKSTVQLAAVQR
ncbi:hypothetical protein [Cedecea sp. MMO-103]|uniref:hypothetical protein n=1 Tax=Cedecea sp. MMO-103 TaxID=3081238 RepID=UPI003017CEC1